MAWLRFAMAGMAAALVSVSVSAPQDGYDRDAYAREYIQTVLQRLDQWTRTFPRDFNAALMRPPVDAGKLPEAAKAGADELRESVARLAAMSGSRDLLTNAAFHDEVAKAIGIAAQVNQAMGTQRFPAALQSDWVQVREDLNNLARVYKTETLAVLEPPGGGGRGGRGGRGAAGGQQALAPPPGRGVIGYIVDQQCAARGKGMWTNAACVARCIREGDKVVLVTEEGKIYQIANPDKIDTDSYGVKVTITGKTNGDTITVDSLQL